VHSGDVSCFRCGEAFPGFDMEDYEEPQSIALPDDTGSKGMTRSGGEFRDHRVEGVGGSESNTSGTDHDPPVPTHDPNATGTAKRHSPKPSSKKYQGTGRGRKKMKGLAGGHDGQKGPKGPGNPRHPIIHTDEPGRKGEDLSKAQVMAAFMMLVLVLAGFAGILYIKTDERIRSDYQEGIIFHGKPILNITHCEVAGTTGEDNNTGGELTITITVKNEGNLKAGSENITVEFFTGTDSFFRAWPYDMDIGQELSWSYAINVTDERLGIRVNIHFDDTVQDSFFHDL